VEDLELATLGWVHGHNTQRLHGYLGGVPAAEFEQAFDAGSLYDWQRDALHAWDNADRRGVMQAVIGVGKTRLGLAAIEDAERAPGDRTPHEGGMVGMRDTEVTGGA
jgi:superfamily II DNA or RNA helicase